MDGYAKELTWISEAQKIEVPFFQRPYVWNDDDFSALIDSFLDAPKNTMPFFGSVIFKSVGTEDLTQYIVIDGQQRITTFTVLIRVLLDMIEMGTLSLSPTVLNTLRSTVYNIEIDDDDNEVFSTKLIPSNSDKVFFNKVMDASIDRPISLDSFGDSPIEKAYSFFYRFFSKEPKETAKQFCMKLYSKNKSIIFIILDDKDDEQKIFDSVNSLGKALSNSDIIKNYLFQKLKEKAAGDPVKEKKVIDIYYKYWDSIFYSDNKKAFWYEEFTVGRITTDHLECFLRDFAVIKGFYAAKKTTGALGLCNAYKGYIDGLDSDSILSFIKEINEYAAVYYEYKVEYHDLKNFVWSDYKNRVLLILDWLDTSTFNPYILKLLKDQPADIEKKLFNFEKFFLSRFLYEGTTKNYNQCCEGLMKAVDDEIYFSEYSKESPCDNKTVTAKLRKLTNKQGVLILFLIEMLKRNGNEEKYSDALNIHTYTLEHIMPQKWQSNEDWLKIDSYDEESKIIDKSDVQTFVSNRNNAVKSVGNFALLTSKLNTSVSNSSFDVKINGNGKKNGIGMRGFAAALATTLDIISLYDVGTIWDERVIFAKEVSYFNILNDFYHFE